MERHNLQRLQYPPVPTAIFASLSNLMELQRDHGRGEDHLSAFCNEGDVIVYQDGAWLVDGVVVGNPNSNNNQQQDEEDTPSFHYCLLENVQIVWTHNCEHGVLRGIELEPRLDNDPTSRMTLTLPDKENMNQAFVEFGPEQLVARLHSVEWNSDESRATISLNGAPALSQDFWLEQSGWLEQ